ncbi:MAG: hypothetical protein IJT62_04365 [Oscillospiraceae bacterium]|nr:hypothetical protein [Oscillospiraceae bacterium]
MAINDESGGGSMVMPVAPAYGGGYGSGGFGFGGDWAWIILLLVLCGGWNNGFGGGFGGGFDGLYPWMNNSQNINNGFRDQMLNTQITSIGDKLVAGQMDAMQNSFALQSQLSQCCCENRAATADLKYTLATEACATRNAATANTQAILDKLCALELDGYKRENDNLRSQLTMANLAASQTAQTSRILADNAAQTVALEQYLNPTPIPAYVVQNPNCCPQTSCGCGCGGF